MAYQWIEDDRELTELVPYLNAGADSDGDGYCDLGALCKEILAELEEQKWNFYGCERYFEDDEEEDTEWDDFNDTDLVTETETEMESDSDFDDSDDFISYRNRFFYT
jgi:hypothetical protein